MFAFCGSIICELSCICIDFNLRCPGPFQSKQGTNLCWKEDRENYSWIQHEAGFCQLVLSSSSHDLLLLSKPFHMNSMSSGLSMFGMLMDPGSLLDTLTGQKNRLIGGWANFGACKGLKGPCSYPVCSHSSLNRGNLSSVKNSQFSYTMSPEKKTDHLEMGRQLTS